jgi:hypothetical protein
MEELMAMPGNDALRLSRRVFAADREVAARCRRALGVYTVRVPYGVDRGGGGGGCGGCGGCGGGGGGGGGGCGG